MEIKMKLTDIKSKLKSFGSASVQNAEDLIKEIEQHRSEFATHLDAALCAADADPANQDVGQISAHLKEALKHSKALGHYGYDLFPKRRLKQFVGKLNQMSGSAIVQVAQNAKDRLALQKAMLDGAVPHNEMPAAAMQLRALDSELAGLLASRTESVATRVNNTLVATLANTVHAATVPVGWTAEQVARPLKASRRWYTGGKVTRGLGHVIDGFLSRDSLSKTGLETSWGVRFIVPGTVGFLGNAGPWVMFYTGQIRDYQTMAVPFRINPGATVATDVATFTWNRPGFGAGTATPLASGYVDSARSKLLAGRDGIAYIRVGEWEGRGAYFTVSAFIPLLPWMHITWNASVFSPGWMPLVRWSRPAVIWVRGQADWLWRKVTAPIRMFHR
mmetsp:Transcript_6900/g.10937  ORF Transcript_6900/g.10937 Transcript_6900/m.10937 type:complete len:389 (-) Transcript_6900:33-1199(-)